MLQFLWNILLFRSLGIFLTIFPFLRVSSPFNPLDWGLTWWEWLPLTHMRLNKLFYLDLNYSNKSTLALLLDSAYSSGKPSLRLTRDPIDWLYIWNAFNLLFRGIFCASVINKTCIKLALLNNQYTNSLLSSSRSLSWKVCSTDINLNSCFNSIQQKRVEAQLCV